MKNITKVISSIVGVVGSLAGISLMTACEEPTTKYGPIATYDDCADNYEACISCCNHSDDPDVCVEDYLKNGFCANEPAVEYGPPATEKYGPLEP